ncbi:MAG: sensor histidine kinase [Clostridia bacterium]|nr:sensor histidine kinase [Clostridia bacterium]
MLRNMSIRVKLLIFVSAILIPLVTLRAISISSYYNNKVQGVFETYENLSQAVSTAFINYIEEIWVLEDLIGSYFASNPALSVKDMVMYLNTIQSKHGGVLRMNWIASGGYVIASTDNRMTKIELTDRNYIKKLQNGEDRVVSDLVQSLVEPHEYIIPVAKAIRRGGELQGIVTAVIDVNELESRLPNLSNSNSHYALLDSRGVIVYRSDTKKTPDKEISLLSDKNVVRALQGETVSCLKDKPQQEKTAFMSVSSPIKPIGWVCMVSSPRYDALSTFYTQLGCDLLILGVVILASCVMAYCLGNNLLRPINTLRSAAKRIMEGDFSARTYIKGKSNDENELAAEAFDKMAESIEQWSHTKTQFFADMSHELKTPLNVIFASVQLIEHFNPTLDLESYRSKIDKQMRIIRQNCYRIMRLTSNLIDISRYDGGFLKLKLKNYDMVSLVSDITLSVQRFAEAKGITLSFRSEVSSKIMACDPDMMERILLNLISNAIKFTDKNGSIIVTLSEKKDFIQLSVADTGTGIPKDKLITIFDRFKQLDNPFNRNQEGSGIGLSLVKALVEAHGGIISVASELGKGTTFDIQIPMRTVEEPKLMTGQELSDQKKASLNSLAGAVSRINIEFSDIYAVYDEIS